MFSNKLRSYLITLVLCFAVISCSQNQHNPENQNPKKAINKEIYNNALAIREKITKNLRQISPESFQTNYNCIVNVKLSQTGEVLDVKIVESSGYREIDKNILLAARNSSPLPLPRDKLLAKEFSDFTLSFHVKND